MDTNSPARLHLTLREVFPAAINSYRKNYRQILIICLSGFFLPQICFQLFFALEGKKLVLALPQIGEGLIPALSAFFFPYVLGYLGAGYLAILGYAALTLFAHQCLTNRPPVTPKQLIKGALRLSPKFLFAILTMLVLLTVAQFIFPPLIFLATLGLMIPVLNSVAPRGWLVDIYDAFTLKFFDRQKVRTWSVFFTLLGIGAITYSIVLLATYLSDLLLTLDQRLGIARYLWHTAMGQFPFSFIYFIVIIFQTAVISLAISCLPFLTVSLYERCVHDNAGQQLISENK